MLSQKLKPDGFPNRSLLTRTCWSLIYKEWNQILPTYKRYSYPALRTLFLVMSLNRFIAGCLHQKKTSSCYFKAFKNWDSKDELTLYTYYMLKDKIFIPVIVTYSSKADLKRTLILELTLVSYLSNVWKDKEFLSKLTKYIDTTKTGYHV
jgi:hypothetical protein